LDFFHSAGDTSHALNSFLVMQVGLAPTSSLDPIASSPRKPCKDCSRLNVLQGNILVTQHVVRLVLLQTKESLLQQLALITQMPMQGLGALALMQANEPAEDIACELLDGLNSLPVECVRDSDRPEGGYADFDLGRDKRSFARTERCVISKWVDAVC
jgi:hypothetical protein